MVKARSRTRQADRLAPYWANATSGRPASRPGQPAKDAALTDLNRDIVDKERVVYTSVLREGSMVATASLTTVELVPQGDGTHLILVEFGAYLDGREQPARREQGTGEWLDALGEDLVRHASD